MHLKREEPREAILYHIVRRKKGGRGYLAVSTYRLVVDKLERSLGSFEISLKTSGSDVSDLMVMVLEQRNTS